MLGTRPILIPLSILLSGSAFLTYFRYLTFPREKYLSRKGRVAGTDVQARAHAPNGSPEIGKQWKFHRYLHISRSSRSPIFSLSFPPPPLFINELAWNARPLVFRGERLRNLFRIWYFENKAKSSDLLFAISSENREWKESREFFKTRWSGKCRKFLCKSTSSFYYLSSDTQLINCRSRTPASAFSHSLTWTRSENQSRLEGETIGRRRNKAESKLWEFISAVLLITKGRRGPFN